jgi:hypothetical protein
MFGNETMWEWDSVVDLCLVEYAEIGTPNALGLGSTLNSRRRVSEFNLLASLSEVAATTIGALTDGVLVETDPVPTEFDSPVQFRVGYRNYESNQPRLSCLDEHGQEVETLSNSTTSEGSIICETLVSGIYTAGFLTTPDLIQWTVEPNAISSPTEDTECDRNFSVSIIIAILLAIALFVCIFYVQLLLNLEAGP